MRKRPVKSHAEMRNRGGCARRFKNFFAFFAWNGEQNVEKRASQIDATENLPRMDSVPGVQLDGFAVKKKARVSLTLPSRIPKNVTLAPTPHSSLLTPNFLRAYRVNS